MPDRPIQYTVNDCFAGSQWAKGFTLLDETTGAPMNITGKTFELVVRPSVSDKTQPGLVEVNSTAATAQGYITVTTSTGTLLVVLSPTATALLGQGVYTYTLWMDPGLSDQTSLVSGTFFSYLVAAA